MAKHSPGMWLRMLFSSRVFNQYLRVSGSTPNSEKEERKVDERRGEGTRAKGRREKRERKEKQEKEEIKGLL